MTISMKKVCRHSLVAVSETGKSDHS